MHGTAAANDPHSANVMLCSLIFLPYVRGDSGSNLDPVGQPRITK
jgi:hypothetical protein